jgi:hypothetical protein
MMKKHGFGTWSHNFIYEGEWSHGQMNGGGTLFLRNGSIFIGFMVNDQQVYGTSIFEDGEIHEGEWIGPERFGQGIAGDIHGSFYEGHWINDEINGYTKAIHPLGFGFPFGGDLFPYYYEYEGFFAHGRPEGIGTFDVGKGEKIEAVSGAGCPMFALKKSDAEMIRKKASQGKWQKTMRHYGKEVEEFLTDEFLLSKFTKDLDGGPSADEFTDARILIFKLICQGIIDRSNPKKSRDYTCVRMFIQNYFNEFKDLILTRRVYHRFFHDWELLTDCIDFVNASSFISAEDKGKLNFQLDAMLPGRARGAAF